MSDLTIRRLPWNFKDVDFIWNPDNPFFSIAMNKLSFFAIGFEKYICDAVRAAEPLIKDPAVLQEAKDFRAQESAHSLAHRKHARALIEQYPGLQQTLDKVIKSYDDLFASRDLKYHLAYIGGLESTFTPSMRLIMDNREALLAKGDARISSLMLWHFCEEVEHRSSGLAIYDAMFGNYWFRVKHFPGYLRHVGELFSMMEDEFKLHCPDIPAEYYLKNSGAPVPLKSRLTSIYGILMSQMPGHNPEHQTVPKYFYEWMKQYNRGDDMTQAFGVVAKQA